MKCFIYAVFDSVSNMFSTPVFHINNGSAIRWFVNVLNNSDVEPSDYSLYCLGEYNQETGEIIYQKEFLKRLTRGEKVSVEVNDYE